MSKVDLSVSSPEIFGSSLPRVFIEKIEIRDFLKSDEPGPREGNTGSTTYVVKDNVKISAYLNIKFSKPAHIQYDSAKDFIQNQLENLYLHGFTSFVNDFNSKLENNVFNLKDFIDWRNGKNEQSVRQRINLSDEYGSTFSDNWFSLNSAYYRDGYVGENAVEIKLSDLIADDNIYNSRLTFSNSFDSEGNEIIEISNIVINFLHRPWFPNLGIYKVLPKIGNVNRMFVMFTIGPFLKNFEGASFAESVSQTTNVNTFNSYFGDITYYQVLENGKIPNKFYNYYVEQGSEVPYHGPVFLGLNGDFYKTEPFSIETLRMRFAEIISKYETFRETDTKLNRNISAFESIIYADNNTSNILGEISNYRSVYPDKSREFKSGEFYNDFFTEFSDIVALIQSYPKLTNKVLYDSLVIDLRQNVESIYDRSVFMNAGVPESNLVSGGTFDSDDYIPANWFQIERRSFEISTGLNAAIGELADDVLGTESSFDDTDTERSDFFEAAVGDSTSEYNGLLNEFIEFYKSEGYSDEDARELANEEVNYQFDIGFGTEDAATARGLFDARDGFESTPDAITEKDFFVRNRGYFFFDYEKALRTRSFISDYLNLTKLQKYFRFNIPYEHFRMKEVYMSRNELILSEDTTGLGTSSEIDTSSIKFTIKSSFDNGTTTETGLKTPKTKFNFYSLNGDGEAALEISDPISKQKYGRSFVSINNKLYYSYLKFINFDVANSIYARRLEGFGDLRLESNHTNVKTVGDGYRLACFEYSDWMDDDVAYTNTIYDSAGDFFAPGLGEGSGGSDRQEAIKVLNNGNGSPVTNYEIIIRCTDETFKSYRDFRKIIRDIYEEFKEYSLLASEICSYNNINNTFNQFFINGINDFYADEKPWIRSAYVYTALKDLLFGSLEALTPDRLNDMVKDQLIQIAPQTGNLESVKFMLNDFYRIVNSLYYHTADDPRPEPLFDEFGAPIDPLIETVDHIPGYIAYASKFLSDERIFRNRVPILSKIVGEYLPDGIGTDPFNLRGAPPMPLYQQSTYGSYFDSADLVTGERPDESIFMSFVNPYDRSNPSYNYLHYAFEEIFYPIDGESGDIQSIIASEFEGASSAGQRLIREVSLDRYPENLGTDSAPRTYFNFLLDNLFRRSTVDVRVVKSSGRYYGVDKAGARSRATRSAFRTINTAIQLLEIYKEHVEKLLSPDSAGGSGLRREVDNEMVLERININYARPDLYNLGLFDRMHNNILEIINLAISVLKNYKSFLRNGEVTSGTASMESRIRNDTYGILNIFNEDNPIGGAINSAAYDSGFVPEFDEFAVEGDTGTEPPPEEDFAAPDSTPPPLEDSATLATPGDIDPAVSTSGGIAAAIAESPISAGDGDPPPGFGIWIGSF